MKSINTRNNLISIPFFASMSDEELADMSRILRDKHFAKNEVILMEEDTPNYLYIVYSGKVKVVQISPEGKEHILAIHHQGDFFGEMAMLDRKTAPATVRALEDSDIGLISKDDFEKYLLKNPKILNEIIAMLCSRLRDAWLMLKVLHFANAEQRVRAVLRLLGIQNGVKNERGTVIPLKLTHEEIAAYASLTRETVTRLMGRFVKQREIELLENKHILLKQPFFEKDLFL